MAVRILDAKYERVDTDTVAEQQHHLTRSQRRDLAKLLKKFPKLFSGDLGVYPHKKMHLELQDNVTPVHAKPYPVPHIHYDTFKKEVFHLVECFRHVFFRDLLLGGLPTPPTTNSFVTMDHFD